MIFKDLKYLKTISEKLDIIAQIFNGMVLLQAQKKQVELQDNKDQTDNTPVKMVEKMKDMVKDKVFCDLGMRKGDFALEMQKYAKRVNGIEFNEEFYKQSIEKGLDVSLGNFLIDPLPEADIYYLWVGSDKRKLICDRLRVEKPEAKVIIGGRLGHQDLLKGGNVIEFKDEEIMGTWRLQIFEKAKEMSNLKEEYKWLNEERRD